MMLLSEMKKRWPAIVGILRGQTVLYAAEVKGGTLCIRHPRGAVVIDCLFSNSDTAVNV